MVDHSWDPLKILSDIAEETHNELRWVDDVRFDPEEPLYRDGWYAYVVRDGVRVNVAYVG